MIAFASLAHALRGMLPSTTSKRARTQSLIARIRDQAATLQEDADRELAQRVESLRAIVRDGTEPTNERVLLAAFALVCEAARRTLGIDYYNVQIEAGLVLARKQIAEMATGEGKTFVAAFPAFLHALARRGVHVMTVNSYLAERDCGLLAPLFRLLDTSVGLLRAETSPAEKRQAYSCDVTYGPGYEFGFDYLRDQIARLGAPKRRLGESLRSQLHDRPPGQHELMQRGHAFAIVDEADSVMIDEATTPLILAGSADAPAANAHVYHAAKQIAEQLPAGSDYFLNVAAKSVRLTDAGAAHVATLIESNAACGLHRPWPMYVEQALHAANFFRRDMDYVIQDGRVCLVDEFTGRIFTDRTLRDGLHQAVEAREGVTITAEFESLARISRQRFLRLYRGLSGMTGTATGSERELGDVYRVTVTAIATHRPCRRETLPTRYFGTQESKWNAIVADIERRRGRGQPVLVGTRTIEHSEQLAKRLRSRGAAFRLLNGRQDESEAEIIARAGEAGAVTIATNMAGRGTDIKLAPGVVALGGLHVIGAERHESARVDRQLAGRAARQGDRGSAQFFVSADDNLIRRHAPWLADRMRPLAADSGEIAADFTPQVAAAQRRAERQSLEQRRDVFAHDHWLETVLDRLASEGTS